MTIPPPPYSARVTPAPRRRLGQHPAHPLADDTVTEHSSPVSASIGPQHNYSAHRQTCSRISTIQANGEPIPVPVSSGNDKTAISDRWVSREAYFTARAPLVRNAGHIVTHQLAIPPNVKSEDLSFPQPGEAWRDVTEVDWTAFTDQLISPEPASWSGEHSVRRKRIETAPALCSSNGQRTSSHGVAASADQRNMRVERKPRREQSHSSEAATQESEEEKRLRIYHLVDEWNQGFFVPRGLYIQAEVLPYSSEPMAGCSEPFVHRANLGSNFIETRRRPTRLSSGEANPKSRPSDPAAPSPTLRSDVTSALGTEDASEAASRVPTPSASEPLTPSTGDQPTSAGPSESISAQQLRVPSELVSGDVDEAELKELRAAFARFLLSTRSKEETATALKELNQELHAQRRQTAKDLKAEMKARRKEIKTVTRRHKIELRVEKKRLRAAEKTQKAELRTLKQSRRELEKRQKQARKEAKLFQSNSKKAAKQGQIGSPPYKGWLDALELNHTESQISQSQISQKNE